MAAPAGWLARSIEFGFVCFCFSGGKRVGGMTPSNLHTAMVYSNLWTARVHSFHCLLHSLTCAPRQPHRTHLQNCHKYQVNKLLIKPDHQMGATCQQTAYLAKGINITHRQNIINFHLMLCLINQVHVT